MADNSSNLRNYKKDWTLNFLESGLIQSTESGTKNRPWKYQLVPRKDIRSSINRAAITVEEIKRALFKCARDKNLFNNLIQVVFGNFHKANVEKLRSNILNNRWAKLIPRINFLNTNAPNVGGVYLWGNNAILMSSKCPNDLFEHIIAELIGHHIDTLLESELEHRKVRREDDNAGISFRRALCRDASGLLCVQLPSSAVISWNMDNVKKPQLDSTIQITAPNGKLISMEVEYAYID